MIKLLTTIEVCVQGSIKWPKTPSWYDAFTEKKNFFDATVACRAIATSLESRLAVINVEEDFEIMRHRVDHSWLHEAPPLHWIGLKKSKSRNWRWTD